MQRLIALSKSCQPWNQERVANIWEIEQAGLIKEVSIEDEISWNVEDKGAGVQLHTMP